MTVPKAYADAVYRGDFSAASERFAESTAGRQPRRLPAGRGPLVVEWHPTFGERFSAAIGVAPMQGVWRVRRGEMALLYGFDEDIVIAPEMTAADRAVLDQTGIIDRRRW